jgi:hypothetical protein
MHFRGAGKLNGDLAPECAAALTAMLDALGKKAGPEDTRTTSQRHHDALEEACWCWLPSCIRLWPVDDRQFDRVPERRGCFAGPRAV